MDRTKICYNLLDAERAPKTVLFLVFRTIEANPGITLNQLRWLMNAEFLLPETTIDTAVGALASSVLFAAVTKWQQQGQARDVIYLRSRESTEVTQWLVRMQDEHPEFRSFAPPIFRKKKK